MSLPTKNASLIVVGTGIKFMSHLTVEAKAYIQQSDKVLYLVNEPAIKAWIKEMNASAESLDDLYRQYRRRIDSYEAIATYILKILETNQHVCVVMYGHPGVFAKPTLEAVSRAKKAGYDVRILPAISAEDCLFADLFIDPAACGCLSFDATDFLIRRRPFDPACHLILWQVSVIGEMEHNDHVDARRGLVTLVNYLKEKYSLEHRVVLYEAAQYPHFEPKLNRVELKELPDAELTPITMLYVPPATKVCCQTDVLESLGITRD